MAVFNIPHKILGLGRSGVAIIDPNTLSPLVYLEPRATNNTLNTTGYAGAGTVTQVGTAITGIGTSFLSQVWVGDVLSGTLISGTVTLITDNTHITVDASNSGAGATYTITPQAGVNDRIAQLTSQAANANHATQATAASRPAKIPNVLGGKAIARANGLTNVMTLPFTDLGTTYTIIAVSASSTTSVLFGQWGSASRQITDFHISTGKHRFNQKADDNTEVSGGTFDANASNGAFHTTVSRRNGTAWLNRVDAVDTPATATVNTTTLTNAGLFSSNGVLLFTGDLAGLYIFPTALSDAQVLQMEAYINSVFF